MGNGIGDMILFENGCDRLHHGGGRPVIRVFIYYGPLGGSTIQALIHREKNIRPSIPENLVRHSFLNLPVLLK